MRRHIIIETWHNNFGWNARVKDGLSTFERRPCVACLSTKRHAVELLLADLQAHGLTGLATIVQS